MASLQVSYLFPSIVTLFLIPPLTGKSITQRLVLYIYIYILFLSALGGSHGIPRVHYKGRQSDYYIMVCGTHFMLSSCY